MLPKSCFSFALKTCARVLVFSYAMFTLGCGSLPEKPNPEVYYKRNMLLNIDGQEFKNGVAVVPQRLQYNFHITSRGKNNDWVELETCHRQEITEDKSHDYRFVFTPIRDLEWKSECEMHLSSLDIKKEKHSFGFVIVDDQKEYALHAVNLCNGNINHETGVSICQAKEGKKQILYFDEEIDVASGEEKCLKGGIIKSGQDGKTVYEYVVPNRECSLVFMGKTTKKMHLHFTIGYEQVLLEQI